MCYKLNCFLVIFTLSMLVIFSSKASSFDGHIRSINAMPDYKHSISFPNPSNPLKAGQGFYVLVRLLNVNYGETMLDPTRVSSWHFVPHVSGTTPTTRPQLGLSVGGQVRYADYSELGPNGETSVNSEYAYYTDLYFKYTVQPGDIGLPVKILQKGGKVGNSFGFFLLRNVNVNENEWEGYSFGTGYVQDYSNDWDLINDFDGRLARFCYGPECVSPAVSGCPTKPAKKEVRTYDFSSEGVHAKTMDCDDDYDSESVWRYVYPGVFDVVYHKPRLLSLGEWATDATVYLWSSDESVFVPVPTNYDANKGYAENGLISVDDRWVLPVVVTNAASSSEFRLKGVTSGAASATLYMSFATNSMAVGDSLDSSAVTRMIKMADTVPVPTITPTNGTSFWRDSQEISLACEIDSAAIYYSTNGRAPRQMDSFRYKGAFQITGTTVVKAMAVIGELRSDLLVATVTKIDPVPITLESALVATNIGPVVTSETDCWVAIVDESAPLGHVAAESGKIGMNAVTYLETKVKGCGWLAFWWQSSCEHEPYGGFSWDHGAFSVDGTEVERIDGICGWEQVQCEILASGEHTLRWTYETDDYEAEGYEDCIWVNGLTWSGEPWGEAQTPFPDLGENPTAASVAAVLAGAADGRIAARIDETNYNDFRTWAGTVKIPSGQAAGMQNVMDAPNAWLSYALDAGTLIENALTNGQMKLETFKAKDEKGRFDFTVSIDGVSVGSRAIEENLKQVFALEGATALDVKDMSAANVDIIFSTPIDGKLRFTAGPKAVDSKTFFMKVKMNQ